MKIYEKPEMCAVLFEEDANVFLKLSVENNTYDNDGADLEDWGF